MKKALLLWLSSTLFTQKLHNSATMTLPSAPLFAQKNTPSLHQTTLIFQITSWHSTTKRGKEYCVVSTFCKRVWVKLLTDFWFWVAHLTCHLNVTTLPIHADDQFRAPIASVLTSEHASVHTDSEMSNRLCEKGCSLTNSVHRVSAIPWLMDSNAELGSFIAFKGHYCGK